MKRTLLFAAMAATFTLSTDVFASNIAYVQNGDNDGAGSLRAALESGASVIRFSYSVSSVSIREPLIYASERQALVNSHLLVTHLK